MKTSEFLREIETIAGVSRETISLQDKLTDISGWDSMAYISFIAMVDERLSASVDTKALATCKTVKDLVGLFPDKLT